MREPRRRRRVALAATLLSAAVTGTVSVGAAALSPAAVAAPQSAVGETIRTLDAGGVRILGARDGLSHNVVFALLQDRAGHLWIGTIDGLNRYDGRSFRIYRHDPDDPASLSNSTVRDLWQGGDGSLWVRTAAGLDRLDPLSGAVRRYPVRAWQLATGPEGGLLVAAVEGLLRYDAEADRFVSVDTVAETAWPEADPAWGLVVDRRGRSWIGTRSGQLVEVDRDGSVRHYPSPWQQLAICCDDAAGRLWIGHSEGLGFYDPELDRFTPVGPLGGPVVAAARSSDQGMWLGGEGLIRVEAGQEVVAAAERSDAPVWALLEDREGALWVGTTGGLRYFDPYRKPFRAFRHEPDSPESVPGDAVSALTVASDGTLWVGTLDAGIARFDPGSDADSDRAVRFPLPTGTGVPCAGGVWSLAALRPGEIWIGTDAGLCALDPGTGRFRPIGLGTERERPVIGPLLVAPDAVWAGSSRGLYRVDPDGAVAVLVLADVAVQGLAHGRDGALWIGTADSELYRLDPGTTTAERVAAATAGALGSEGYWGIAERPGGDLWLASDRGLVIFEPSTGRLAPHPATEHLPSAAVYALVDGVEGATWLSTNHGLLRLRPTVSAPGLDGLRRYGVADGVVAEEFNRRAVAAFPDGRLAFGAMGGLTVFDPRAMDDNPHPPPIAIDTLERFRRDGTVRQSVRAGQTVRLPWDDTGLVIEFAALTFSSPERVTYAYRLDGVDEQWIRGEGEGRARYPALAPGTYRFSVRAANGDGVWNHEGAHLEIVVPPPWWATIWFRSIVLVGMLAGLVAAVRQVSTRSLRRRLDELERERRVRLERERISRDLHDNVGSQVATILSGLELARLSARSGEGERAQQLLDSLGQDARRTMAELRDTVWSLHSERVTVADLAERLREAMLERGRYAEDVVLLVEAAGDAERSLDASVALELFRIAQEAVSNALRHSGSARVRVVLDAPAGGDVALTVLDEGRFRTPDAGQRGHGLDNMRARAERVGGTFSLDTTEAGTTVSVRIAGERARP